MGTRLSKIILKKKIILIILIIISIYYFFKYISIKPDDIFYYNIDALTNMSDATSNSSPNDNAESATLKDQPSGDSNPLGPGGEAPPPTPLGPSGESPQFCKVRSSYSSKYTETCQKITNEDECNNSTDGKCTWTDPADYDKIYKKTKRNISHDITSGEADITSGIDSGEADIEAGISDITVGPKKGSYMQKIDSNIKSGASNIISGIKSEATDITSTASNIGRSIESGASDLETDIDSGISHGISDITNIF
jgi:hypothetical protein